MADTININGIPYAAKDVQILWLGSIVVGITEINFNEDNEVEKTYVLGTSRAVSRTKGKEDAKGDMTLLLNVVAGIEIQAKASITQLNDSDLTILYKALPIPLKQTLKGVSVISKSQAITAGGAGALAHKCGLDIMEVTPLTAN